ncbi:hypothetical protein F5Y13DRAFT_189391 [Hypoxylon sp. FL1857]|nr:hypothetical protein F5Y13DRAFT_189391 [Hypoxylon sp. FL1857]
MRHWQYSYMPIQPYDPNSKTCQERQYRLSKLIKFFVRAFSAYIISDDYLTRRTLLVDSTIMSLLHKIDQFHSGRAEIIRFYEDVPANSYWGPMSSTPLRQPTT